MMDVSTEGSLNQSIDKAKRHYSSLFFLPSFKKALLIIALFCIGIVGLSTYFVVPSLEGLSIGLLLGGSLFVMNFIFDFVTSKMVLKDPIFVLRRTVALSYFGWIFWLAFVVLGVAVGILFSVIWWVKLCLLGFSALLTLRTVVFFSTSSTTFSRRLIAALLQPFPCIVPFVTAWIILGVPIVEFLPYIAISPILACGFGFLFLTLLDRLGRKTSGVSSMSIFRAFMLNWVAALNGPLEEFFEELGKDEDVEVSLLKFESSKPKAAVIVPLVHPGPFKNIGSSLLPSMLKQEFEKEYHCDACVPLGLLGHELDAASQAQNHKIIDQVLSSAKFHASVDKATQFVRVSEGFVTVSCQVFGKIAFLSFTLAPKTTEDLPQELGKIVREEAEKQGFTHSIVVNAHNSLTDSVKIEASLDTLKRVASKCLEKALSLPSYPFEVGSATIYPKEFSLKDGLGTGGITAIVTKVAEQKTAYVVIDGNNMVSGLREKILSALNSADFQESEIFTTDTHAVSAVVLGERGYHPVGEAMNQELLISYIKQTALSAASHLEPCTAGCLRMVVPKVRVIGGECLESLTLLVDTTIRKAKQIVLPIFALEGLLLILLLALL
jgi:putative membrane protein